MTKKTAKKKPPKGGTTNKTTPETKVETICPKCSSTARSDYTFINHQDLNYAHQDPKTGQIYNRITVATCMCLDCKHVRRDRMNVMR